MTRMLAPVVLLAALPLVAGGTGMSAQFSKLTTIASQALGTDTAPPAECTGAQCCEQSSCMNLPGMRCKASRGSTKCIGASFFPYKKGTCGCTSGACSKSGVCPASGASFTGLYAEHGAAGHPQDVSPEDFTLAFGILGMLGASLSVGGVALGIRLRRSLQAPIVPDADEDWLAMGEDRILE
mmetsp:Transcript_95677/g.205283  ORF Transcript_95677/g.205283 Transcript_95677/m.205283 type:complete len:182 (-) Transcript_95677:89-634(-)